MKILIITNHYAFMNNTNCINYFIEILKKSKDSYIFYDQTHFFLNDFSRELSDVLKMNVFKSGVFFWKERIRSLIDIECKEDKEVFIEGLFSPFQKHIYSSLKFTAKFSCYSAVMPYFFQNLKLDEQKISK